MRGTHSFSNTFSVIIKIKLNRFSFYTNKINKNLEACKLFTCSILKLTKSLQILIKFLHEFKIIKNLFFPKIYSLLLKIFSQ